MGAAAAPMLIGSAIGAFTNKDPLKGALLGGFMGAAGGALMPTLGGLGSTAANTAATAGNTAATTVANASALPVQAFTQGPTAAMQAANLTTGPTGIVGTEAAKAGLFSGATPVTTPALQGQGLAQTTAIQRPLTLGMPGVEPGQGYEYTLGDRFGQIGQFAQQNPVLTQMAAQTGQSLLQQQERPLSTPGLLRGSQIPMEAAQYNVGIPKVSLI
jgi:hypothetical protein